MNSQQEKWKEEFDEWYEKKYRHAINIFATEYCNPLCDIRHEYHYHSLSQDKMRDDIKSFISTMLEKAKTKSYTDGYLDGLMGRAKANSK